MIILFFNPPPPQSELKPREGKEQNKTRGTFLPYDTNKKIKKKKKNREKRKKLQELVSKLKKKK